MATPNLTPKLPSHIESKIERVTESGCWIWLGSLQRGGYGHLKFNGRYQGAHRVVYEALRGAITKGADLDHLCRVRCCVNPDHLEPVTRQVNLLRGQGLTAKWAKRTHCLKGHEYSGSNVSIYRGARRCIACRDANNRKVVAARDPVAWRKYMRDRQARLRAEKERAKAAAHVEVTLTDHAVCVGPFQAAR